MPSPKPQPLNLSEAEREGLEKLIKRHNVRQQIAMRGWIVLAAGRGQNNSQIACEMDWISIQYGYDVNVGWAYSPCRSMD